MSKLVMMRICIRWAAVWAFFGWVSTGCIAGVHHHRIDATVDNTDHSVDVAGTVDSVDLGIVGDFRYFRMALPFEGQRHRLEVDVQDGGRFDVNSVFELRSLRLDVPVWSFLDLSDEPSGHRYPGNMRRRHSLEVWASGSVGITPINPATASVSVAYYRYGAVAARLYGGVSFTPYHGLERGFEGGTDNIERREGYVPGMVLGLEVTLAAGEYGLELVEFILDLDRQSRESTDRWQ